MTCSACQAPNDAAAASCIACGQPLVAEPASPKPGALFAGRYQILSVLGRGGMGMVYRAQDLRLDETVALKVIRPDLARESHLHERFRSEIKLARRIRHRNVCSIYGDGEEQGILWICMELVDGVDLRQLVRERGGLPPSDAFDAAIQIAEGLAAIHEVGIIHRDLKTANVMRDSRGVVRLMDFGLAKQWRAEDSGGPTASGHVVGTPDYMSPEQARGEKLTFASDLYALGVITFELFTGEPPFRGDTPLTTLLKHLHDPPPFDSEAGRRLPAPLVPVLRRALAKAPRERFASAADMTDALRAAQAARADDASATPLRLSRVVDRTPTLDGAAPTKGVDATEDLPEAKAAPIPARPGSSASWNAPLAARRWGAGWFLAPLGVVAVAIGSSLFVMNRLALNRASSERPSVSLALPTAAPVPPPMTAERVDVPAFTMPAAPASPSPAVPIDASGEHIRHDPTGCLIAGQFPVLPATVRATASVARARVYFKSALGSGYYFIEMRLALGRFTGKLPKPKLEASPITYYIDVQWTDGRRLRTREITAVVARLAAECPPGSRVAEIGPPGAVTVFGATLEWMWLRDALSLDALVGQLKDPDPSVREAAAAALRTVIPSVKAVVEKAVADLRDRDPDVREQAADDLDGVSEVIVKEAMIPLVAALRDKDPAVQMKAAESLGEIGPPVAAAARALRTALRDREPRVRKDAMEALATIGSVVGATMTALKDVPGEDKNPNLRKATVTAYRLIEKAGQ